ncbi:MAG: anaerobic ribonucleoside-triphosphate reductase, partial [Candidatus Ranarchaeia archaeon]
MSRHKSSSRDDELVVIETANGDVLRVTRAHPIILRDNKIKRADEVEIGDEIALADPVIHIKQKISLDEDFAYLIGLLLTEECKEHKTVEKQLVAEHKGLFRRLLEIAAKSLEVPSIRGQGYSTSPTIRGTIQAIHHLFEIPNNDYESTFPNIIFSFDRQTIGNIVSGLIDRRGRIVDRSIIEVTVRSYTLALQLRQILSVLGVTSSIETSKQKQWGLQSSYIIRFTINGAQSKWFRKSLKAGQAKTEVSQANLASGKVVKISEIGVESEYVYDVTTANQRFMVGNIVAHNSNFDTYLAPFIRHDSLGYKQVKQAMQEFMFNMNVPCYDDKTEILTAKGFKLFKELDENDHVMTLRDGKHMEFKKPNEIVQYPYSGTMVHIKTKQLDLLVTPNHKMLVERRNGSDKTLHIVRADELRPDDRIPTTGRWQGNEKEKFVLPALNQKSSPPRQNGAMHPAQIEITMPMGEWLRFLGLYIAKGYVENGKSSNTASNNFVVGINHAGNKEYVRKCLEALPFAFKEEKDRFVIYNRQLWRHLILFGEEDSKWVPDYVKESSVKQIRVFLDAYYRCNGKIVREGKEYHVPSERLQTDIGELILKAGSFPLFPPTKGLEKTVVENTAKHYSLFEEDEREKKCAFARKHYQGYVYCVEVPNHVIYVRRNGTCTWSGNTRVGFQCVSEDTEILTPKGWATYDNIKLGDLIKTFNVTTGEIEEKPVQHLFSRYYVGPMYHLTNATQDQMISPGHRVVYRDAYNKRYFLNEIEKIVETGKPIHVPVAGKNVRPDVEYLSDREIKVMAKNVIKECLNSVENVNQPNPKSAYSPALICGAEDRDRFIPSIFLNMSQRQSRLFLENCMEEKDRVSTLHKGVIEALQQICVNAGWGFVVEAQEQNTNSSAYVLRVIRETDSCITKIERVHYEGVIWCPTTENNTVIARRNNKVFITGNTPFTNISMDLNPSPILKDEPVIVGGEFGEDTYGDYQSEMDMLNLAFAEVMLEGDANGRVFTFPIPTYSITKEFDWKNPIMDKVFEMSAKYGIPYFCLSHDTKIITDKGIKEIGRLGANDKVLGRDNKFYAVLALSRSFRDDLIKLVLENGEEIVATGNHRFPVNAGKLKTADALNVSDKLLQNELFLEFENGFRIDFGNFNLFTLYDKDDKKVNFLEVTNDDLSAFYRIVPKNTENELITDHDLFSLPGTKEEKERILSLSDLFEIAGYLLATGNLEGATIQLTNRNGEVLYFFEDIVKKYFGASLTKEKTKNALYRKVSVTSVVLSDYLKQLGIKSTKNETLLSASIHYQKEKYISALLRGVFDAKGAIKINDGNIPMITLSLPNEKLIRQIMTLLMQLGIVSFYSFSEYPIITIQDKNNVQKFRMIIGSRVKRKVDKLFKAATATPSLGDKIIHISSARQSQIRIGCQKGEYVRVTNSRGKECYLFTSTLMKKEKPVKIEKVSRITDPTEVVDIVVANKDHLFTLSSGILTHNSNFVNSDMKPEDARSMCCFKGDHKIFCRVNNSPRFITFRDLPDIKDSLEVPFKGRWVKATPVKIQYDKPFYEIRLRNGLSYVVTDDHIHCTSRGDLPTSELVVGDLLEFNFECPPYKGHGSYELGKFLGLYVARGVASEEGVLFNISPEEKEITSFISSFVSSHFATNVRFERQGQKHCLLVHSIPVRTLIDTFVSYNEDSRYFVNNDVFSVDMTRGIWDAWFNDNEQAKDASLNHCSQPLAHQMMVFARLLGKMAKISRIDKRPGSDFDRERYVIYQCKGREQEQTYRVIDNKVFTEIVDIKRAENKEKIAFCVSINDDEPYFQLDDGLVTHNCRLRLDNRELRKRGGGLFGANPLTGCYDEETEILTVSGWKPFRDLTTEDVVYTRNSNGEIELHKPFRLFEYKWDGLLYHFKTDSLDLLVTPNHRMLVEHIETHEQCFVEAKDFDCEKHGIPPSSVWRAKEQLLFRLTPDKNHDKKSVKKRISSEDELEIPMEEWLKFFGVWLASGDLENGENSKRCVSLPQYDNGLSEDIRLLLERLPFKWRTNENKFMIYSDPLWGYLAQLKNEEKSIPEEIKSLAPHQLKTLLEWMTKINGHDNETKGARKSPEATYWASSRKLAEDLQEIVMKSGQLGIVTAFGGFEQKHTNTSTSSQPYCVKVKREKLYRLRPENISKEYYKGKVYCCEVKNNTIMVRRRGRAVWCGNSIGVVTLNLPRIGYLAKDDEDYFERLDELIELASTSLEIKRKILEHYTKLGLYPYSQYFLRDIFERTGLYWSNHFSTIGIVGMNESLRNYLGVDIVHPEGRKFALKVMDHIRERLVQLQEETGNIYNFEATPAEGASHRLARLDVKRYPNIVVANDLAYKTKRAAPFYTNSSQLPVDYVSDVFEALELQDEFQTKYTGGCISEDSLVMTEKGLVPIKDIVKNPHIQVYSLNEQTHRTELKDVLEAHYVEVSEKDKLKIEFENGVEVLTSSWHPFYVLEKDLNIRTKRADEITAGDFVVSSTYPVTGTKEIGNDLSWLAGGIITNGHGTSAEHSTDNGNNAVAKKVREILNNRFGRDRQDNNGESISFYKKKYRAALESLFQYENVLGKSVCRLPKMFHKWS